MKDRNSIPVILGSNIRTIDRKQSGLVRAKRSEGNRLYLWDGWQFTKPLDSFKSNEIEHTY